MALDAFVYCDCFEKDNLRCNPPGGASLRVLPSGDISCDDTDQAGWLAFTAWKYAKACLHQGMILVHHRLGSAPQIDALRSELRKHPARFPILLEHVLYSGSHTCDWIPFDQLAQVTEEIKQIDPEKSSPPAADALRLFKIRIAELVIAAQITSKPICF